MFALGVLSNNAYANSNCGKIKIAEMNWASAELIANIDKIILEEKFGCQVELVSGATMNTFKSMQNQNGPDIAPEMWVNAIIKPLKKSINNNTIFIANNAPIPISRPLEEAKHGMFSYFLMKGMEGDADTNSDNKITARELHAYVEQNVVQQSSGSQTPELQGDKERVLVQFN